MSRSNTQKQQYDEEYSAEANGGKENPITPLVFLFRGLLIQLAIVIPIGIWWIIGTERVLLALGQQDFIASMTDSYLRVLAPGLWYVLSFYMLPICLRVCLEIQKLIIFHFLGDIQLVGH